MERIIRGEELTEAFRAGTAEKIMRLLESYISKRVDFKIEYGIADGFENAYGKFRGYFGFSGGRAFRINFLMGQSDFIHSIDVFADYSFLSKESTYVFSEEANAVQIAKRLLEIVTNRVEESAEDTENRLREERSLIEGRKDLYPWFEAWLNENDPETDRFELLRTGSWDEIRDYMMRTWYDEIRFPSDPTFKDKVRRLAADNFIENPELKRKPRRRKASGDSEDETEIVDGEGEEFVDTEDDDNSAISEPVDAKPDKASVLGEELDDIDGFGEAFMELDHWQERWTDYTDFWEYFLKGGWDSDKETSSMRGMIVTGTGGTGKSYYAKQMADRYPNKVGYVTGKELKGSAPAVAEKYFENQDKDIIVFDDARAVMAKGVVERFKSFWEAPSEGGGVMPPMNNKQEKEWGQPIEWDGASIIITNLKPSQLGDDAVKTRFAIVHLNFSKEEVIDKIATEYSNPDVTDDDKRIVAKFFVRVLHTEGVKMPDYGVSFRAYKNAIMYKRNFPKKWKRMAKRTILAIGV